MRIEKKEFQYNREQYMAVLEHYIHITYPIEIATRRYLQDTGIREGIKIDVFGDDDTAKILIARFSIDYLHPRERHLIIIGKPGYDWARYNKENNMDSYWYKVFGRSHIGSTSRLIPTDGDMEGSLAALYLNPNLEKFPVPQKSDFT